MYRAGNYVNLVRLTNYNDFLTATYSQIQFNFAAGYSTPVVSHLVGFDPTVWLWGGYGTSHHGLTYSNNFGFYY